MAGRHVREWSLVVGVALVYSLVRGLGAPDHATVAVANAERVVALERSLGLLVEAELQALVLAVPGALTGFKLYYVAVHVPPIAAALACVYVRRPLAWPRFRDTMIVFTLVAGIVHILVPLAPPWFVDGLPVRDLFGALHAEGMSASTLGNPFTAMPSMHFGWALGAGLAFLRLGEGRFTRGLGALHPLVMGLAIVVTGNHYLLDAVASALLLGMAYLVVKRVRPVPTIGSADEGTARERRVSQDACQAREGVTSGRRPSERADR